MVLEEMVEARSDFAIKRSLRENKTPPNWKFFMSKHRYFYINCNKYDFILYCLLEFQFLAKKFVKIL